MGILVSILGVVVALGVVIFVHEFGHFIVAKKSGIRVEQFSFGFGREIVGFTKGETRYTINWVPLGGYVRMAGEFSENYEGPVLEGKPEAEDAAQGDRSRDFMAKPWYTRIAVALAGPAMNYVFSIVVFISLFWLFGISEHINKTEVGKVMVGMPAEQAGIRAGDHIVSVAGIQVRDFIDIARIVKDSAGKEIEVMVKRESKFTKYMMLPQWDESDGRALIGILLAEPMTTQKPVSFFLSVKFAAQECWNVTRTTLVYLGQKIRKWEKPKEVAGPVGIVQMTARAVKGGPKIFITFIAFLSVAIGLFNLFPIPLLDGGHVVFYLIEGIRRRPVSSAIIGRVNVVGLVLLLSLMAFATINDISRFTKKTPVETSENK